MKFFDRSWYVLCDEFSWFGWKEEGACRVFGPDVDRQVWDDLIQKPPKTSFFLIESVWQNFYAEGHSIKIQFPRLMKSLKEHQIPIVFWNKEDPVHFDRFSPFAMEADLLLTSDADCIPKYLAHGFKGKIQCLPFPAQPQIHRQYFPKDAAKKVFFAGRYGGQHAQRVSSYENFLKPALETGVVDVYARQTKYEGAESWPDEAKPYIVGCLDYPELIQEYSKYLIGLSISSVADSVSMFPRRVVEMTMANILVISDRNEAVENLFPEIPQAKTKEDVPRLIDFYLEHSKEREEIIFKTQQRILKSHTYGKALKNIRKNIRRFALL